MYTEADHAKFILSPVSDILTDAVAATQAISGGLESYPVHDYVLQSAYLRTTGFIEQKLKCICWEMATHDYDYRYQRYNGKWNLGECSDYRSKNEIYKDLLAEIADMTSEKDLEDWLDDTLRKRILDGVKTKLLDILEDAHIRSAIDDSRQFFLAKTGAISAANLMRYENNKTELFVNSTILRTIFEKAYRFRNRAAHNLKSYQQNLPSLKLLADKDNLYDNYYFRFYIMFLIDAVFICLFSKYLEAGRFAE